MRILVVDDEKTMLEVLRMRLEGWGFETCTASDGREALEVFDEARPDLVISDVKMPGMSGIDLVESLGERQPDTPVLLITSHGTVDLAVEAMKHGARDFLTKPLDYDKLRTTLDAMGRDLAARRESSQLDAEVASERDRGSGLVGSCEAMVQVRQLIEEVAATDAAALITGESGTGKELAARAIHNLSSRRGEDFVAVNAAAIPEELMESEIFGHEKGAFTGATGVRQGCFELAHGGTLLLDELAEMPLPLQPKLLRVLEDGRVRRLGGSKEHTFDVRLVAATNREPRDAIRDGRLREDLYYRLNVFTIQLPPLRERGDDLRLLAQHFLGELNRKHGTEVCGLRDETLTVLRRYRWPGNVRELRNVMERAVVVAKSEWIEPSYLPPYVRDPGDDAVGGAEDLSPPAARTLAEAERALILETLEETGHNKAETARRLGVTTKTIYNKLKSYGIS
jgi:DNA-binding NtrC family response regulator